MEEKKLRKAEYEAGFSEGEKHGHEAGFSEGEKHGIEPVSYTHLDVYKRQVWNLSLRAEFTFSLKQKNVFLE